MATLVLCPTWAMRNVLSGDCLRGAKAFVQTVSERARLMELSAITYQPVGINKYRHNGVCV